MSAKSLRGKTLADLFGDLGGIAPDRIRFYPPPGTAALQDVIDIEDQENIRCELIKGVLVEKSVGDLESTLAVFFLEILNAFVRSRNLGLLTAPDGAFELMPGSVSIPDVSFTRWDRLPGPQQSADPIPAVVRTLPLKF